MEIYFDELQEKVSPQQPEIAANSKIANVKRKVKPAIEEMTTDELEQIGKTSRVIGLTFGEATGCLIYKL
jgi:hypothetical protein